MSLHTRNVRPDESCVSDGDKWLPSSSAASASADGSTRSSNPYQQLHRLLKKVARAVDKLDLHSLMSLRKVVEVQIGKAARLTAADMEALRNAVLRLRENYGELEKFLTYWSRHTGSRRLSIADDLQDLPPPPDRVCDTEVVEAAEALRIAVCQAHGDLLGLIDRHKRSSCSIGEAALEEDDLSKYHVHYRYYAALIQHLRFKGLSWFGCILSSYLRGWMDGSEVAQEDGAGGRPTALHDELQQQQQQAAAAHSQQALAKGNKNRELAAQGSSPPPVVDISDLCTWVSEVLAVGPKGETPVGAQLSPGHPLAAVYQEISNRFGEDSEALNNLFQWLLRMQKGGGKAEVTQGAFLDTAVLQPPGGSEEVSQSVEHYVYDQLGGAQGALDWLAEAESLGFDTSTRQTMHSRCSSWDGSMLSSRSSSQGNSRESSPGHGRGQTMDSDYFELCKPRSGLNGLAVRVRENAILLHIVYDGKVLPGLGAPSTWGDQAPTAPRGPRLLPWDVLQRCTATASRVVKHYLAHELPAKYQH